MKKILVIDDEEWLREMVQMALRQRGFEVIQAENGAVGIDLARRELPDLILCDVNMGKLDGYFTLATLRNDPITATIPFILMTGLADNAGMRHGMELGADDYLPKPFTLDALYRALEARLKKVQTVKSEAERKLADLRSNITMMLPHELRTPLNGIVGYSELLVTDSANLSPAEIAEMGKVIYDSSKRLERLIENFLIYAQIELLATDPNKIESLRQTTTVSPARVITRQAQLQAQQARRPGDLYLAIGDCPVAISEEHLAKIISELVQNAFKFSEHGSRVQVSFVPDNEAATLSIANEGRGFSTEHLTKVGAYMQFDRKMHEQQGLGLGLSISRRLVELYGGGLSIQGGGGANKTLILVKLPRTAVNEARLAV